MFENLKRKSSKKLPNTKSTSTSKILKKESIELPKRNHYEIAINTESLSPRVTQKTHLKDKKCKSQCVSKEKINDRKSVDLKKMLLTTRTSTVMKKKIKDKCHLIDQVFTEHRQSKQRPVLVAKIDTEGGRSKRNESKQLSKGRSSLPWDSSKIPYTCTDTLKNYSHFLTKYEQSQISQYKKIYYIGHLASKRQAEGQGFDNEEEYIFVQHDHVAYRYEMLAVIGKGSYGQVIRAYDHKLQEQIALKIIKNKQKFSKQAYTEIKILTFIKEHDPHLRSNAVRIKDFVLFRKHVCILFQMLGENLYELIMRNNYSGLNFELIRRFALQLLTGLQFLRDSKIIHCDLKPENILLIKQNKPLLRIIDFGSSCFDRETIYTYIQSRYYRAPEITLGMPYGMQIDIWSIGCIFAELYTGVPIFPGQNERQQMKYMVDTLGKPSKHFLSYGSRSDIFFTEDGELNGEIKAEETVSHFSQKLIDRIEDEQFSKFIQLFLKWNPYERITPIEAMRHPWILKGLPEELQLKVLKKTELPEEKQSRPNSKSKSQSKEKRSSIKVPKPFGPDKISKGFGIKF